MRDLCECYNVLWLLDVLGVTPASREDPFFERARVCLAYAMGMPDSGHVRLARSNLSRLRIGAGGVDDYRVSIRPACVGRKYLLAPGCLSRMWRRSYDEISTRIDTASPGRMLTAGWSPQVMPHIIPSLKTTSQLKDSSAYARGMREGA